MQKDVELDVLVDVPVALVVVMVVQQGVVQVAQDVAAHVLHVQDAMVAQDAPLNALDVRVLVMDNVLPLVMQNVLLDVEVVAQLTAQELVKTPVLQRVQQIVLALALLNVLVQQQLQYK